MWPDIFESKVEMLLNKKMEEKIYRYKNKYINNNLFLKTNAIICNYDLQLSALTRLINPQEISI